MTNQTARLAESLERNIAEIRQQRDTLAAEAETILTRTAGGVLSDPDQTRFAEIETSLERLKASEESWRDMLTSARSGDLSFESGSPQPGDLSGDDPDRGPQTRTIAANPLAYSSAALDDIQAAIDTRESGKFSATLERAALTTSTFGAPRVWGSNVLNGPRILHLAAGVPQQPSDAVLAQLPVLTLPTATGSVGENTTLSEYASSTAGSVTLARFGRWTDLSRESLVGADAGAIVGMHQVGVARDLDKVLIDSVETAAGSAVAFTADVPAAIRKAMAQVSDNTAAADVSQIIVLAHPDNAALLQDVAPIGGQTMGEGFSRFSGALVYASSAVDTGFITVANLAAGARYFEARATATETHTDVKTGTVTVATSVICGYGLALNGGASGAFIKVDVVTP